MNAADVAAKLRRAGFIVYAPSGVTVSPAGKSGNPDGSRTSRAANATSTSGQPRLVTGGARSKVVRSAQDRALNLERFAAFAAAPDVAAEEEVAPTARRAPLTRSEFMRQAAEGMPSTPEAAADQTIKLARATGLIPKATAKASELPPITDPGARAVALARQAGVIR